MIFIWFGRFIYELVMDVLSMMHVIILLGVGVLKLIIIKSLFLLIKTRKELPSFFVKQVDYSGRRRQVWGWPPLAEECHGSAPVCTEKLKKRNLSGMIIFAHLPTLHSLLKSNRSMFEILI